MWWNIMDPEYMLSKNVPEFESWNFDFLVLLYFLLNFELISCTFFCI